MPQPSPTNKPSFHLIQNIRYALAGMREVLRSEASFRTQLAVIALIGVVLVPLSMDLVVKWILFVSTWLVLLAEAINSAIERVVDLVTQEQHPLAGQAKDIGSFAVLIAFVIVAAIWGIVFYTTYV